MDLDNLILLRAAFPHPAPSLRKIIAMNPMQQTMLRQVAAIDSAPMHGANRSGDASCTGCIGKHRNQQRPEQRQSGGCVCIGGWVQEGVQFQQLGIMPGLVQDRTKGRGENVLGCLRAIKVEFE